MKEPQPLNAYIAVGLGGAAGSILRFMLGQAITKAKPDSPFIGIIIVNILGSFLIGILASAIPEKNTFSYQLLAIGLLGGFTTFSSFSLDFLTLIQRQQYGTAFAFALGQVFLGLAVAAIGFSLGSRLL